MLTLNNFVQDPNTGRFRPKPRPRRMIKLKFINDPNFHERALAAASKIEQRQTEQNLPPASQENAWPSTSTQCSSPSISDMNGESDVTLSAQRPNPPQISPKLRKYADFAKKAKNLNKIYKKLDDQEHEIHNHIQEIYNHTQEIEKLKNPGLWYGFGLFGNNEAKIADKEKQIADKEKQISNLELGKQLFSNIASILECANNQGELEEALGIYSEFINETEQRQEEIDPNQIKLSNLDSSRQNEVIRKAISKNNEIKERAEKLYKVLTETVVELVKVTSESPGGGADGTTYRATIKCLGAAQEAIRKCINKDENGRLVADPYDEIIPYQILQTHTLKRTYSTIRDAYEFACIHHIPVCFSAPPMPEPISSQNVQTMKEVFVDENNPFLKEKEKDYYSRDIFSRLVPGYPLNLFIRDDEFAIEKKHSLGKRLGICRQLLEAIGFMNDAGLIHHDLHLGNVMLDDSGAAYVIDLGRAIYLENLNLLASNASVDNLPITPPESLGNGKLSLEKKTYNDKFDVYSLGLMFFSIIYGMSGNLEIWPFLFQKGQEPYNILKDENGQFISLKDANGEIINDEGYLLDPENGGPIQRTDPESRTELFNSIDEIVDRCTANCDREQLALQQLSGGIKTLLQGMLNPNPENRCNAQQAEDFVSEMISSTNS